MIEVRNVSKQFGVTRALNDVSFTVRPGEVLGFLGPNGAGKTTAMRIITGILTATQGSVRIGDFDVDEQPLKARAMIGYLPESVPLYRDMHVEDYLGFIARLKGVPKAKREAHLTETLARCGLTSVRNRLIGKLSKGYRQRVGIAQALTANPPVLVLDEPTEGLDPKQIIEIRNLIRELGGERTIILSTHILPEVSMICERVIIINRGSVVAVDTPANLNRSLQKQSVIRIVAGAPRDDFLSLCRSIPGVRTCEPGDTQGTAAGNRITVRIESSTDMDLRPQIASRIVQKGWELFELSSETMTLEDIFIQLVTREPEGAVE